MMLAILLLAIIPLEIPVTETCDAIEVNHCYSTTGQHSFDQVIFWTWNRATCRYEVRDWRMLKDTYPDSNRMLWVDGDTFREVRGRRIETWSQVDMEVEERKILPVESRRGLTTFFEE